MSPFEKTARLRGLIINSFLRGGPLWTAFYAAHSPPYAALWAQRPDAERRAAEIQFEADKASPRYAERRPA